jgi:rhomboid protease GluP
MRSITLVSVSTLSENSSNPIQSGRPTLCRNCGAIIAAGGTQCGVCGASSVAAPAPGKQPTADYETLRFARAVLSRPNKLTIAFLIANLFIYLLMWESSGLTSAVLWRGFPYPVLIAYGAKMNQLIDAGQWWRFITPMFIHVNLPHVLVNMYSLWIVGPYVEKLYGSAKFAVFWVVTGIAGVVCSYLTVRPSASSAIAQFLFKAHDEPSAGASGALFGLVGVLFVFGIKFRRELPEGFKRAFGTGMLPIILINLFIGYIGRGFIDNGAHVGGLVTGAALALVVQYRRPGESKAVAITWRVLQIAVLSLVAVSFIFIVRGMRHPISVPVHLQVENSAFVLFAIAMNQGQEEFSQAINNNDPVGIDEAIKRLEEVPQFDPKADELRGRFIDLLKRARSQTGAPANAAAKEKARLAEDFSAWSKEYNDWLKARQEKPTVVSP